METQPHSKAAEPPHDPQIAARRTAMALYAEARAGELADALSALGNCPLHTEIRTAETGLMMVRGRIGGDGAPFNLGEATVTRCAVQLASGEIGYSYILGRDRGKARLAALLDALWQTESYRRAIERHVLAPVRARAEAEQDVSAARTAATRVDFFTLVRGED
jgi:alpha-D-ribose 1-methylphosphonate 5-triphosphate synthase subunit PhnG